MWPVRQELLDHAFLKPTVPAGAPELVGLTRSQLRKLLAQLSTVATADGSADIDVVSEEVFRQLSKGDAVDLTTLLSKGPKPGGAAPAYSSQEFGSP